MNIGLDTNAILISRNRGVGNYTIDLYKSIIKYDKNNHFVLLNWSQSSIISEFGIDPSCVTECLEGEMNEFNLARYQSDTQLVRKTIRRFLKNNHIDVFINADPMGYKTFPVYKRNWFGRTKLIGIVYDLIPLILRKQYLKEEDQLKIYISYVKSLKKYDLLFSISNTTKRDIIRYSNISKRKIVNIYGDSERLEKKVVSPFEETTIKTKFNITKQFLLFVAGAGANKNVVSVIKAFKRAQSYNIGMDFQLVIVCELSRGVLNAWRSLVQYEDLAGRVVITGSVSDEELKTLYNIASWAVFPSLYEGLGLPVIEAWRHHLPVMTSNNSSLNEIAKGAAVLVNPFEIESITEGLIRIMSMGHLERNFYIQKGIRRVANFSWHKSAAKVIKVLQIIEDRHLRLL